MINRLVNESLIGRFFRFLHNCFEQSNTKKRFDKFVDALDPAETSFYGRYLRWAERIWLKIGAAAKESLFAKLFGWLLNPHWLIIALALYLPLEYVIRDVLSLGIIASVWEELLICAGIAIALWRCALGKTEGLYSRASSVEAAMILYFVVMLLLMMLNRPFPAVAFAGYRAQVEYAIWFIIALRLFEKKSDAKTFIIAFAVVVLMLSFHGIYQFIIGVENPASWTSHSEMGVRTRVFSITGSPNILGSLILLAAPIMASLIYYLEKPWQKFAAFCATGVICLCDLFTFSRGSWVGLVVAVILFAVLIDGRLLAVFGAGVAAILVAVPSITNRITYLFTDDYKVASAVGGRALRWSTGKMLLLDNSKWLGFGLGRFGGAVAMNNKILDETETFKYFYMDNYYLKTLVESGYIGLGVFILLLAVFAICGVKAIGRCGRGFTADRSKDQLLRNIGNDKLLAIGVFCGMVGVLVHCYFENIFEEPYMMAYYWTLAAALLSLGIYCKE